MTSGYWNDLKLARKGLIVVLLPVVCLLLGFAALYGLSRAEWNAQRRIERTLEIRQEIARALTGIVSSDSSARGFALTQEQEFVKAGEVARQDVTKALGNLSSLVYDNRHQQERLVSARELLQERYRLSDAVFHAATASAADPHLPDLVMQSKEKNDALTNTLLQMEAEELQQNMRLMAWLDQLRDVNVAATAATVAFGVSGGIGAILLLTRSIVRRTQLIAHNAERLAAELPLLETSGGSDEIGRLNAQLKAASALLGSRTRALRESESRLQAIVDNTSSVIFMKNLDSRFLMLNQQFEKLFGIKREAVMGRTAHHIFSPHYADVYRANDLAALESTEPLQVEEPVPHADGLHTYLSIRFALRDSSGKPYAICGISTDITERKRAEQILRTSHDELEQHVQVRTAELQEANTRLRKEVAEHRETADSLKRTHAQLLQAQKMEALGKIAGGIAHDFNNILTTIMGYGMLLLQQVPANKRDDHPVAEILRASERANALSKQLLSFSRPQPTAPVALSLNQVITGAQKMLAQAIGGRIALKLSLEKKLGHVKADVAQIEQLLLNFVINSRDAISGTGEIEITTRNVTLKPEEIESDVSGKDFVVLSIRDSGAGIGPEVMAHLFEPFFTTKRPGQGTGLGLATCSAIVQQSQGWITCQSHLGEGTCFTVHLPEIPVAADQAPRVRFDGELPRGKETLLVVEDEPAVGNLFERLLTKLGYQVLRAEHGEEAERKIAEYKKGPIDLVLTDLDMPRMDGTELIRRLTHRNGDLKVILTSGNGENFAAENRGGIDFDFIAKPFTLQTLAQKVREVLDRA